MRRSGATVRRTRAAVVTAGVAVLLTSCAPVISDGAAPRDASVAPPPAGAVPDYQLGGAYEPDDGVGIVGRDRGAAPAEGRYSICYVNGFQTQPGERDLWDADLLVTVGGEPLIDPDWPDEVLLDTSSADKRDRIVDIVGEWIRGCADDGFDAVEFDNLDSFTRSEGVLDVAGNLALATAYVEVAHGAGLAAGQKNAAEYARTLRDEAGFDFAVVEECAAFAECDAYTDVYGDAVVDIEYTDNLPRDWAEVCADPATPRSVVLRDRDLTTPGDPDHVFETC
ncbi:endo alpha-1,4 polygalactosaminidase [Microbacterium radiodurans]|uniref:Endo alpha-1,4 polygalactosaminidase n=1 Tax=Microbacterium radiodurans TaxID=661398 RepID=A0A5J5IU05_9MICO|nr:endo alpha-1,4 polygalactosaminidase [Microbacterium radiodurans]